MRSYQIRLISHNLFLSYHSTNKDITSKRYFKRNNFRSKTKIKVEKVELLVIFFTYLLFRVKLSPISLRNFSWGLFFHQSTDVSPIWASIYCQAEKVQHVEWRVIIFLSLWRMPSRVRAVRMALTYCFPETWHSIHLVCPRHLCCFVLFCRGWFVLDFLLRRSFLLMNLSW